MPDFSAPVATGVQTPNFASTLSGLMGIQQQGQNLQASRMQNQQNAIDLQETQNAQGLMRNIKSYQDNEGNVDFTKLIPDMMQAAPKNGAAYLTRIAQMQQAHTDAANSVNTLDAGARGQVASMLYSLKGQKPEVVSSALDALAQSYPKLGTAVNYFKGQIGPSLTSGNQDGIDSALDQAGRMVNPVTTQAPNTAFVPTQGGTQPYNTNPLAPGGTGPRGAPMVPPNITAPSTGGGTAIVNTTTGQVGAFGNQPAPQVDFPPGETGATQAELQMERSAAKQQATQAPQMHNLNRGVIQAVDTGLTTGNLGNFTQQLSSLTGFHMGNEGSTDYNVLGKLLERSALTSAQSMGPHTNAGLEAQVRANGSTDYTPQAIRKIAALNDAITTGSTLYQSGLEGAISGQGGSVFAKRQFDQQWAKTMNPTGGVDGVQALRYKNAIDSGDATEKAAIIKEVGGPASKGAQTLLTKLRSLQQLSGQQ